MRESWSLQTISLALHLAEALLVNSAKIRIEIKLNKWNTIPDMLLKDSMIIK